MTKSINRSFLVIGILAVLFCIGMIGMANPVHADGGPFYFDIVGFCNSYKVYVQNPDTKVYGQETGCGTSQVPVGTYVSGTGALYLGYAYAGSTWLRVLKFTSGTGGTYNLYNTTAGSSMSLWSSGTFTFSTSASEDSTGYELEEEVE